MSLPITIIDYESDLVIETPVEKHDANWTPIEIDSETIEFTPRRIQAKKETRILPKMKPRKGIFSVMNMPVAFIDGEGANVPGPPVMIPGKHGLPPRWLYDQNYSYLNVLFEVPPTPADSNYKYLASKDANKNEIPNGRLSTYEILSWLADLPTRYAYCAFYMEYDVEMWLRDIPAKERAILHSKHILHYKGFVLKYIPKKIFRIQRERVAAQDKQASPGKSRKHKRNRDRHWVKIWDMYGYFQMSFMSALKDWQLGTPAQLQIIKDGKDTRGDFSGVDERVRQYAYEEAQLGVTLAKRVRDECKRLGLNLSGLHGAGTIADAMFRKNGVADYVDSVQPPPIDAVLRAYFGGRFDTSRVGYVGNASEYDINSAYPDRIRQLPCTAHTRWEYSRQYQEGEYSLWYVRWNLEPSELWAPFPYRTDTGTIRYLRSGAGWYYGMEVRAAMQLSPNIQVIEGYHCIRECDERPFSWMESIYAQRQTLKAAHDLAEKILKLGMNSGYGKLAESKTAHPQWQNLLLAGMITAGTRAKLLEAVAQNPSAIVLMATDAVVSTEPLDLPVSPNELGKWEIKELEDVIVLQNGVYQSPSVDGRGVPLMNARRGYEEIDWSKARAAFSAGERDMLIPSRSFLQHLRATASPRTERYACHWETSYKKLDFYGAEKIKELRDGWLYPMENDDAGPSHKKEFIAVIPIGEELGWMPELWTIDDSLDVTVDDPVITSLIRSRVVDVDE